MPIRGDWIPGMEIELPKKKKDLPVQKEFEYNPVRSFRDGNPYTMAFCYPHPLYHRPFVVKGGFKDCNEYLKTLDYPIFVHLVFYYKGSTRRIFKFYQLDSNLALNEQVSFPPKKKGKRLWELYLRGSGLGVRTKTLATFKRVPRRWIRELNLYVKAERRRFHDV